MSSPLATQRCLQAFPGTAQGASSTAEFVFQDTAGAANAIKLPPGFATNRPFKVRAWGKGTWVAGTFTLKLNKGTGTGSVIAASSAITASATPGNWLFEATVLHDSTSAKVVSLNSSVFINVAGTGSVVTAPLAFDSTVEQTLNISGTFGTSNAGNSAQLLGFEVEAF